MKVNAKFKMPFRRRREGKTNYAKRLNLLKGNKIRMVVRKTNKGIIAQFVAYEENGDKTIIGYHSSILKKMFNFPAKRNTPTSYLLGLFVGKKALEKGVKEAIVDIASTPSKGSIVFAAVKGAKDAGINISMNEEKIIESRIKGSHLNLEKDFEEVKNKIMKI